MKPDETSEVYDGTNPVTDAEKIYWDKHRDQDNIDDSDRNDLKKNKLESW